MKTSDDPAIAAFEAGVDFYGMVNAAKEHDALAAWRIPGCGLPWEEVRAAYPAACDACATWWKDSEKCGTWICGDGKCIRPMGAVKHAQKVAELEKKDKARGRGK